MREKSTTDEHPPVKVGGRFQWSNLPRYGKWIGTALVALLALATPAVLSSWQSYRITRAETEAKVAEAEGRARQAKQSAEAGFQVTKEYVQILEHRLTALEAATKRAPGRRRPLPVVAPPKPKPLPSSLNAAEAQVRKAAPVVVPIPDGGT